MARNVAASMMNASDDNPSPEMKPMPDTDTMLMGGVSMNGSRSISQ